MWQWIDDSLHTCWYTSSTPAVLHLTSGSTVSLNTSALAPSSNRVGRNIKSDCLLNMLCMVEYFCTHLVQTFCRVCCYSIRPTEQTGNEVLFTQTTLLRIMPPVQDQMDLLRSSKHSNDSSTLPCHKIIPAVYSHQHAQVQTVALGWEIVALTLRTLVSVGRRTLNGSHRKLKTTSSPSVCSWP